MNIYDKIKSLRERKTINQKTKTMLMASVLGTAPVMAQTMSDAKQDIVSTSVTQTISSQAKQYFQIKEVPSLAVMRRQNYAEYHSDIDAIVYNRFKVTNADKYEQKQIDAHNAMCYSTEIENHEQQHRAFHLAGISAKIEDGSCVLAPADIIRANILEELLCRKAENKNRPMSEVINNFKNDGHEQQYIDNSLSAIKNTSILSALVAEENYPERIEKKFNEVKTKHIDDNHYAQLYTSDDGKYQVWELYHNDGFIVKDSTIMDKSPVKLKTLLDKNGNEVKNQEGKSIYAQAYTYNSSSWVVGFVIDNIDKEVQGYNFTKAKNNFNNLCQEYMDFVKLSPEDRDVLMGYINTDLEYLSQHNQNNNEIADIKEMYKGVTLEEQQKKHKENYQAKMEINRQNAQKEKIPNLIPVDSPSASKSGKINTTAFYIGR